jgi:PAS domain S-box-containing protein
MVRSGIRVLHVDDDEGFCSMASELLGRQHEALSVETVHDAETALSRLAEGSFDCVVSDYDMPGSDGLELLRRVRAEHGDVPFVFFTGKGSEEIAGAAISAGVTDYLRKGTGTDRYSLLANRVVNAVGGWRARGDRAQLEGELRTEKEHFRQALENSPVVAFRLDADLRYTWVGNPHPDFDADAVIGRRDDELLPPEAAETVMAPKREALETGEGVRRRVEYDLPSGPVSYELTVEPLYEEGKVVGVTCAALDLADYLDRGRDLTSVLERVSDAFFALDREWRFTYVNERAEELLERSAEELRGTVVWEAFPEAADSTFRREYERAAETQETVAFEEFYGPLGRWFEVRAYPSESGLSVYFRDVTERKTREREHAERKRLFETLGETLSHDLRTPLSALRGRLELARVEGDTAAEHLSEAVCSLEQVETLVEQFATVMREGGTAKEVSTIDLVAVAERVWGSIDTADARLHLADPEPVLADEAALSRLLQNLFRNSVEHSSTSSRPEAGDSVEHSSTSSQRPVGADDSVEHGDGSVTVTVGSLDGRRGFYVADNGPGIARERRRDVLEPGVTDKEDGTGFGLVSVRQIAFAHEWTLTVTESECGGARFEFEARAAEAGPTGHVDD